MTPESTFDHFMVAFHAFKALARREVARHELSMNAFIALRSLASAECRAMRELTEHLDVTPGAVTLLVDRLAERGLVTREASAEDRRVIQAALTPAGRALVEQVGADIRAAFAARAESLSDAERDLVAQGFALLSQALQDTPTTV